MLIRIIYNVRITPQSLAYHFSSWAGFPFFLFFFYDTAVLQVHIGVRGFVKEAINGTALANVSIVVASIRHNLTTGEYGEYYRLLLPGTYNITAVAPGWVKPLQLLCIGLKKGYTLKDRNHLIKGYMIVSFSLQWQLGKRLLRDHNEQSKLSRQ